MKDKIKKCIISGYDFDIINRQELDECWNYITNLQELDECWNYITNLQEENERYKNIVDEAIDYLRDIRQSTFSKYNSNEWNNCLSFNDDIKPLLDKLQKLKGE